MSHLNEPMFPAEERPEDAPVKVEIVPPYTDHPPCGMPGCGKARTGKWAEPIFRMEVRGIASNWGGLDNGVTDLVMCDGCHRSLGALAEDAFRAEEEAAVEILKGEEE